MTLNPQQQQFQRSKEQTNYHTISSHLSERIETKELKP